jgi:hypothetical protein
MPFVIKQLRKNDFYDKKICSSDLRVECKPPSNKVELIQTNLDFEEELKKIESSFE